MEFRSVAQGGITKGKETSRRLTGFVEQDVAPPRVQRQRLTQISELRSGLSLFVNSSLTIISCRVPSVPTVYVRVVVERKPTRRENHTRQPGRNFQKYAEMILRASVDTSGKTMRKRRR